MRNEAGAPRSAHIRASRRRNGDRRTAGAHAGDRRHAAPKRCALGAGGSGPRHRAPRWLARAPCRSGPALAPTRPARRGHGICCPRAGQRPTKPTPGGARASDQGRPPAGAHAGDRRHAVPERCVVGAGGSGPRHGTPAPGGARASCRSGPARAVTRPARRRAWRLAPPRLATGQRSPRREALVAAIKARRRRAGEPLGGAVPIEGSFLSGRLGFAVFGQGDARFVLGHGRLADAAHPRQVVDVRETPVLLPVAHDG